MSKEEFSSKYSGVVQLKDKNQFVVYNEKKEIVAHIDYELLKKDGKEIVEIQHTVTDPNHSGKGFAGQVTKSLFDWVNANKDTMALQSKCSYTQQFLSKYGNKYGHLLTDNYKLLKNGTWIVFRSLLYLPKKKSEFHLDLLSNVSQFLILPIRSFKNVHIKVQ
ncbi:hypothetical protein RFI_05186 [Reticulomyxa filosa]|uniref:N-acetyltransferase domain-containing protein n=1 Tax=Reticulomyxa filosa TaxID=46433 RepID=X6P045_RETFI|nr:hypothetical protein RFI_05186 [Reticulomyxa filosa]|eukprot:ETO31930.1 hypothetical protein RFI_05186 [Reticulomyxa filosa]